MAPIATSPLTLSTAALRGGADGTPAVAPSAPTGMARRGALALAACLALAGAWAGTRSSQADAAVVRSYADGPVLYLNKWETRVAAAGTAGAAGGLVGMYLGPVAAGMVGGAIASVADQYANSMTARGYCIQVKMQYWNPRWTTFGFYSWWPCQ